MSDDQLPTGSMSVKFPDGTSKVFRGGTAQEINSQAATYWQSKHPAPKAPPAAPIAPTRQQVSDFHAKFLEPIFNNSIPNQAAKALALDPQNTQWNARLKLMQPVSRQAILEHADAIRKNIQRSSQEMNSASEDSLIPGGIHLQAHGFIQNATSGYEGANKLQTEKGFLPEVKRFGSDLLDPQNIAMAAGGAGIGRAGGPLVARGITALFAGSMGKSAFDKLQQNDPGGAAADLTMGVFAIGAHALAEKIGIEKEVGKKPAAEAPAPEPAKLPQKAKTSSLGDAAFEERTRQAEQQKQRAAEARQREAARAQQQQREATANQQQRAAQARAREQARAQQQQASVQPAPPKEEVGSPKDDGTPHPEVDKFNANTDKIDPRIVESPEIAAAKQRYRELNGKKKLTRPELLEFGEASLKFDQHKRGVQAFADQYKAATGKDLGIKQGTIGSDVAPVGRSEILDRVRQSLREGHTTVDKLIPDAESVPKSEVSEPEIDPRGRVKAKTGGKKPSNAKSGSLNLGPGEPGSPQERLSRWIKEQVESPKEESGIATAQPSAEVSRETSKRFSALEEENVAIEKETNVGAELGVHGAGQGNEVQQHIPTNEAEALPQNVDEGNNRSNVPKRRVGKTFRPGMKPGFIDLSALPPKSGSGPVGRVMRHGTEVLNAFNVSDAARVTGPVRAEMITRDLYDGLDNHEQGLLGEYLVGNRLHGDASDPTIDAVRAGNAGAHPRRLSQTELDEIASNPKIQAAITKWQTKHLPVLNEISRKAGVSAQAIAAKPHYFPLVSPDFLHVDGRVSGASEPGGYASWESKSRPQSTARRNKAMYTSNDYSTDVGAVLRTVLRSDEPKAAINELWRTLDAQGLIAVPPSGKAGAGWKKPVGYVGDEIQGKLSSMPADLVAKYGGRGKVYLPQDVVQTMDEINAPKLFSGSRKIEAASRISRALISVTLGLNVPAVPFHIYRQTAMFRASTVLADAKRNPATVIGNTIPVVNNLLKGVAIASRNADDPTYRAIYQHLVEINAISPRSMEGLTGNLGRLPLAERWNVMLHDAMFGVPHGKGFNGWAGRIAVEAYLARTRFEHSDSPERDREYIAQFGAYMRRLSPELDVLGSFNPFIRTHGPRVSTSLKLVTGDTGLKTPRVPGQSEATFRMREALDRIGSFAMIVALPVVGLVVLNKLLSGKYPWENGKGHELDINLGHGHFIPIGRLQTEFQPAVELSGAASRMHRERGEGTSNLPAGLPKLGESKVSAPSSSSLLSDVVGDATVGAGNTAIGMMDSPALNAGAAILNKRVYLQHDKQKKSPDFMNLSPTGATAAQRAINTVAAITGTSTLIPTQGYRDDGQNNIARSILDYFTQGAVKSDHPGKGIKAKKFGRH